MELSELKIKRELKRAKLFEVQKIVKRIRLLRRKKGTDAQLVKNQRKAARLLTSLEAIKDLSLGAFASELYQVSFGGSLTSWIPTEAKDDVQNKAKQKLISNKRFQCNISTVSSSSQKLKVLSSAEQTKIIHLPTESLGPSVRSAIGLGSDSDGSASDSESAGTVEHSAARTEPGPGTEVGLTISSQYCSGVSAMEGSWEISHISLLQQHGNMGRAISSKGTKKVKVVSKHISGEMKGTHLQSSKSVAKKRRGSKSIQPEVPGILSSSGPTPIGGKGMESVFVETLSAASQDISTGMEPPKKRKMMLKQKKNRAGQRARQKQWEERFGRQAKHMQKEKQHKVKVPSVAVIAAQHSHRTASASIPQLHPSWEAKRRKKTIESGIGQFQGQKIVFSDSD